MRIEVQFRHMDRSESLEAYAIEKLGQAVQEFIHAHDSHVLIWLVSDLNRTNRGTPEFCCEVEVRYPKKKDVFISKSNQDIHLAINEAAEKLGVILDEAGKRELSKRRTTAQSTQTNF
jgi:ribosome-associated translation inhibitor RaiA